MRKHKQIFLALSAFLAASSVQAGTFGYAGRDGSNGFSGASGRSGEDVTAVLNAASQPSVLDLRGDNGEPGSNGQPGDDASSCYQPRGVAENLWGANGGDGGDAGAGGDGGNGGHVLAYISQWSDLKKMSIYAPGGLGAPAGNPAPGGYGCHCSDYRWRIERCVPRQVSPGPGAPGPGNGGGYDCYWDDYTCSNGTQGNYGRTRSNGSNGSVGDLSVVIGKPPMPADITDVEVPMEAWDGKHVYTFQHQHWEEHTGARALLGARSVINDTFRLFAGMNQRSARVYWDVSRPITDFSDLSIGLHYNGESIAARMRTGRESLWYQMNSTEAGTETQVHVTHALRESEAREVTFAGMLGSRTSLKIELLDAKAKWVAEQGLTNSASIKVEVRGLFWVYYDRFEGKLPPNLLHLDGDHISIDVGRLPIDPEYLKPGKWVHITLDLEREMGSYSTHLPFQLKKQIR